MPLEGEVAPIANDVQVARAREDGMDVRRHEIRFGILPTPRTVRPEPLVPPVDELAERAQLALRRHVAHVPAPRQLGEPAAERLVLRIARSHAVGETQIHAEGLDGVCLLYT